MRLLTVPVAAMAVLAGGPQRALADFEAYTCDAAPTEGVVLKAQEERGACTGFQVHVAGRLVSRGRLAFRGSGTFQASPDGRTVVFVHSDPYTTAAADLAKMAGVVFFRDGAEVASHTIAALLERPKLVGRSTSHTHWVSGRWVAGKGSARDRTLEPLGATWALYTSSFRQIEFDTTTGTILHAGDTELWTACDQIAYGIIERRGATAVMEERRMLKGTAPSPWTVALAGDSTDGETLPAVVCASGSSGKIPSARIVHGHWP